MQRGFFQGRSADPIWPYVRTPLILEDLWNVHVSIFTEVPISIFEEVLKEMRTTHVVYIPECSHSVRFVLNQLRIDV